MELIAEIQEILKINARVLRGARTLEVLIPGKLSTRRTKLREDAVNDESPTRERSEETIETIRRIEEREPIGMIYAARLNSWLKDAWEEQERGRRAATAA